MRRWMTLCAMLLASCGPEPRPVVVAPPIPADLLVGCPGWQGSTPVTKGALIDAAHAEQTGRRCANEKIATIAEIVRIAGPQ